MIKLKDLLKEELIAKVRGFEVFKNPKTISRMDANLRAISNPDGDLFVIESNDVIHSDLAKAVSAKGYKIPTYLSSEELVELTERGYIYWVRKGNSGDFYLGESYTFGYPFDDPEFKPAVKKYARKTKSKNPQYNFIAKSIYD